MRRWFGPLRAVAARVANTPRRVLAGLATAYRGIAGLFGRPGIRLGLHSLALLGVLGGAVYAGLYVVPSGAQSHRGADGGGSPSPSFAAPAPPSVQPPEAEPQPSQSPSDPTGRPQDALAEWAGSLRHLGIPKVALQAYGYAELALAQSQPGCHLTWPTLAGIGRVESNHGRSHGAVVQPDGRSEPPVVGLPLDGGPERKEILDTDNGRLDGDKTYDRAVGAMQFIPTTWAKWATDGDHDGVADPYDIDDAALAAARYLCAGGRDLATGPGWTAAVLSYNHLQEYVRNVFAAADGYGRASRGG